MPVLSYQISRGLARTSICLGLLANLLVAGCASLGRTAERAFEPLPFPSADASPHLVLYGNLGHLLPTFDRTPPIERFLYGPNNFGKTVLRNPQGMAILGSRLLVCDQGHSEIVAVNLADGGSMFWGDPDHCPRCPVAISVGGHDDVYVADTNLQTVLRYGADQRFREEIKPPEASRDEFRPAALCVDGDILYIGNVRGHRVDRRDLAAGRWLESLTPPGSQPGLVAPTGLAFTREGTLLIVDSVGGRVFRYHKDGRWLDPIGRPGQRQGDFVRPKQVCVTAGGLVLVTDAGRQSIMVFDENGLFFTEIHEQSTTWKGLTLPFGILALTPEQVLTPPRGVVGAPQPPTGYVVVSDSLGRDSLLLLGVFEKPDQEPLHAR